MIVFYHICDEVVIMDLILFWSKYGGDEGRLEECTTEKVGGPTFSVVALTGDYINKKDGSFHASMNELSSFIYALSSTIGLVVDKFILFIVPAV